MKKIKKILSLAAASLVMGGLILSSPINTTTVNAEVVRNPYNEKYRNESQIPIKGDYQQRLSFKTRSPQTANKPYWSEMLEVKDGSLKMRSLGHAKRNYKMDDSYVFFVLNKDLHVRFKFLFSYKPKEQIDDEFNDFINEFNKVDVGIGNYLIAIGQHWNGTVLWDTNQPNTALKRIGYNNFEIGYTDKQHKYSTLLRVDHDGLQEVQYYWGDERVFTW